MTEGWKKIKSKVIHKNPWFELRDDDVIRPDGKPGKYYYLNDLNSVAVIAEDKNNDIYLVGQTRYPINSKYSWEVVGGRIEKSESPIEAAKRELQEETGLVAGEWNEIGFYFITPCISSEKVYFFLAKNFSSTKAKPEPTENITVKKVSINELRKMIINNEFFDGFSLAAINKYLLYKNI